MILWETNLHQDISWIEIKNKQTCILDSGEIKQKCLTLGIWNKRKYVAKAVWLNILKYMCTVSGSNFTDSVTKLKSQNLASWSLLL